MKDNAIIAEVRRIRHQIAKECNYDLHEITRRALETAARLGFKPVKVA